MAQPPRYERRKDFAEDYADSTDHVALNAELDGVAQTTDAIRANLALLQRDDGALKNGIVTADSLDQGLLGDIVVAVSGDIDDKVQQATAAASDSVQASVNSENSAVNSQNYAEQSLASAGVSLAGATDSAASRDRAQEWAEKLSGPVTADLYSAHYWANKAKYWAAGPAESISVAPSAIQPEINAQAAIDRLANAAVDYASPTAPLITWPYMTWADTGNMLLKRRNAAGTAWVVLGPLLTEMAVKTGDASQRFKAAPSAAANEVTVQSQVPGVGQALQDLTASRVAGAPYINSTGKGIKIFIAGTTTIASGAMAGKLSGTYYVATAERGGSGLVLGINFPVPDGVTYMVETIGASIGAWLEER